MHSGKEAVGKGAGPLAMQTADTHLEALTFLKGSCVLSPCPDFGGSEDGQRVLLRVQLGCGELGMCVLRTHQWSFMPHWGSESQHGSRQGFRVPEVRGASAEKEKAD